MKQNVRKLKAQFDELKQKANTLRPRGVSGSAQNFEQTKTCKDPAFVYMEPREPCKFLNGQHCCNLWRNLHRNSSVHKFVRIRVNSSLSPTGKALRDETMAMETTQTGSEVIVFLHFYSRQLHANFCME